MKILVAEDDRTTSLILQVILQRWGYDVICTTDGIEAWDALQCPDAPQLAVLDWEMPGMDGPTLCRKLRAAARQEPLYLILLTARSARQSLVEGLEAGADDYIPKPFDNDELRARILVGRRILELQAELRQREKLQGVLEMSGAVCHEINQPLQSILGYTELLLMDLDANDPRLGILEKIRAGVECIGSLTRKMMTITKYQSKDYMDGKTRIVDIELASQKNDGTPAARQRVFEALIKNKSVWL
jgi:DNA-binding response OmpR family regulator